MTRALRRFYGASAALAAAGIVWLSACCAPAHVVSSAGETAAGAIKGAGKTAASATRTAGKTAFSALGAAGEVVHSGVTAAGGIAQATIGAAADVATAPFVIFKDAKSGRRCRVQWREGMTLSSALREARVTVELEAVNVLRGDQKLAADDSFVLKAGDLVELTGKSGVPILAEVGAL